MALADPFLYTASPTVEVGGMSYPLIAQNLERMRVTEALGGLSSLELVLADSVPRADGTMAHAQGAGSPLELGAGIRVFAGPAEVRAFEIFDGQITAIESEWREGGAPTFTVLAEDRLFPARRKRRTRLFEDSPLSDVLDMIASDYGLTAEIRDGVDSTARDWMQLDETDLAFLRRILGLCDCDVQVVGDKLQVGRIGKDRRSLVSLTAGSNLKQVRITADIAEQVSEIRLASFDPGAGEAADSTARAAGFGPGTGKAGADLLDEKLSAVKMHSGRNGAITDAEADTLARYEADRRARAFVTARGIAQGSGELRVGSWIELSGVNAQFANQYSVTRAVHRFDRAHGYETDFEAQCAYLGEPA
jgi:phage protein D